MMISNEKRPEELYFQWHITDACNFRCRHCYQHGFTGASDLPLSGLIKIYENIACCAGSKKTVINITGGEPFLRKDIFELLRYLDRHDATREIAVITNASLIDEGVVGRLKEIKKLKQLKISLDGASEKTNDAIRRPGAFRTALEKINLIQEKSSLEVVVMLTVMRSNAYEIPALLQLCREIKADGLIIERFIPLGQSRTLKSEVISRDDWKRMVGEICEYMETDAGTDEMLAYRAFWIRFGNDDVPRDASHPRDLIPEIAPRFLGTELLGAECNLGEDAFAILPNGDLLPCRRFAMKIGNLLDRSLREIVSESRILREVTDKSSLKGKCGSCHIAKCRGCRAFAFAVGDDYLAEDSLCWL